MREGVHRGFIGASCVAAELWMNRSWRQVFIDINGNRELPTVAHVLAMAVAELRPPLVCVKSRALWRHVRDHGATRMRGPEGP